MKQILAHAILTIAVVVVLLLPALWAVNRVSYALEQSMRPPAAVYSYTRK
jgi:hypothetical protein